MKRIDKSFQEFANRCSAFATQREYYVQAPDEHVVEIVHGLEVQGYALQTHSWL
jgi:hypothetical protein